MNERQMAMLNIMARDRATALMLDEFDPDATALVSAGLATSDGRNIGLVITEAGRKWLGPSRPVTISWSSP